VLQVGAIKGNLVGDPIDDDPISCRVVHVGGTEFDVLGDDPLIAAVDFLDESGRKTPLAAHDETHSKRFGRHGDGP